MKNIILYSAPCFLALFIVLVVFICTPYADAQEIALKNPLNPNFSSIPAFIAGALKALALIALPIITLFFVISGFLFLTAQGNEEQLKRAKKNFLYVVIGALLILGAWIIATLIAGTVNQLTGR